MKKMKIIALVAVGMVVGATLLWAAQQYTVDALRCSELRVTYAESDGAVLMLRGEILPMSGGERVGDVRTFGFTLDAASIPTNIVTGLENLRNIAETWAESQTGWVTE